mmetsp:Transcript_18403/g.41170  ORF Transcript_18403/g.41170 Transcript_18403/m.41170 type:complete len:237 (+) Transcript_18403:131-841(+)
MMSSSTTCSAPSFADGSTRCFDLRPSRTSGVTKTGEKYSWSALGSGPRTGVSAGSFSKRLMSSAAVVEARTGLITTVSACGVPRIIVRTRSWVSGGSPGAPGAKSDRGRGEAERSSRSSGELIRPSANGEMTASSRRASPPLAVVRLRVRRGERKSWIEIIRFRYAIEPLARARTVTGPSSVSSMNWSISAKFCGSAGSTFINSSGGWCVAAVSSCPAAVAAARAWQPGPTPTYAS